MLIKEFGNRYRHDIDGTKLVPENGTPLFAVGTEILEMVLCYASDGEIFFGKGDLVNAAASFAYGYGWLNAGKYLGYLSGEGQKELSYITEKLPENLQEHLTEKTFRYQKMLGQALASVNVLPDKETVFFSAAEYLKGQAENYLKQGCELLESSDELNALINFSYGYGWLDASVRSGLIGVLENRHLFTI